MAKQHWRKARIPALLVAGGLLLSGCLQDPNAGSNQAGGFSLGEPEAGDGIVTIMGAFGGDEEALFNEALQPFIDETGIQVDYVSDQDFTNTIQVRVSAGDLPDIGLFPQPGGVMNLAEGGHIYPIDEFLDYDSLNSTLVPGFLDSARYKGRVYAVPMRMAVKSIVWYPKKAFEENGWNTAPATLQELDELTEQIRTETSTTPWCIAWGSDQATGWVGTDWIEEYVLRMWGPQVYDDWIFGRIPFNDERIVQSIERYGELATPENVIGGNDGIINTPFSDAMNPAFSETPGCYMMRQGNFAIGFFPPEIASNLDEEIGIFVFPRDEEGYDGQPMLGGGDLAAAFSYDADTIAVMEFLSSDQFGGPWAEAGGWLSPHTTFDTSLYPNETTRQIAELAVSSDVFRYDGSDVMPREVGSGSFWTEMVAFQSGKSAQDTADAIAATWPESEEEEE
ncbi:ABC transporter substrate-binding protein [Tessaracoccus flavus]|uniref:Sugar ABC transporter substrate-binding protein n=1 Tax=Tessaracoccus flavus TaxID=1610493 RepID=A0A1Q2CC81_9ACTN|nr:ABC transporter substrate-binding protein [Tessaracoccus flavus]AQP43714.1 sugar ABC transporter substrate-binding protein [Tessaracoccus flavus]SDZ03403.1 alpha-glucoside transport system substrate-binding protein [Tessaracoccus flavus]